MTSRRPPFSAVERLTAWLVRYAPWVVISALVGAGLALWYAMSHLGFITDTNKMLSPELPFRQTYDDFRRTFPNQVENLVIVLDGPDPETASVAGDRLVAELRSRNNLFTDVYRVGGEEFFAKNGLLYLEIDELESLGNRLAEMQPLMAQLTADLSLRGLFTLFSKALRWGDPDQNVVLGTVFTGMANTLEARLHQQSRPLSWQRLMVGDSSRLVSTRALVLARPYLDYSQIQPAGAALSAVRTTVADLGLAEKGVRARITGEPALAHEELETIAHGVGFAGLLALSLVAMVLIIGLRSIWLVLATLATLLTGLALTAGAAALMVGHLNLISVAFAVLYVGLGVDYAVHFSLRHLEFVTHGLPPKQAIVLASKRVAKALVLCTVTTAVGFYAFIPTDFAGVSELGVIAGTGMFISLAVTLGFFPPLVSLLPAPSARQAQAKLHRIAHLALLPEQHARPILMVTLLVTIAALLLLPQLRFDANPLNLRDPDAESVATFRDLLKQSETSLWSISLTADNREQAQALVRRLNALDTVAETVWVDSFIPNELDEKLALLDEINLILGTQPQRDVVLVDVDTNQQWRALQSFRDNLQHYLAKHPGDSLGSEGKTLLSALTTYLVKWSNAPPRIRAEELVSLQTDLLKGLPSQLKHLRIALSVSNVNASDLPTDLTNRWVSRDGRYLIQVFPTEELDTNAKWRRFVESVRQVTPRATGEAVISLASGDVIVRAFIEAFSYAFLVIIGLLLLLLPQRQDTWIVMGLMLLSGAWTLATMVLVDIPLNFANIIALPLLIGMGVDSGIHMVQRAREGEASNGQLLLLTSTSRAVLISALTTACGFGSLAVSPHPGMASMGLLLSIGLGYMLIATLIVLPGLLAWRAAKQNVN